MGQYAWNQPERRDLYLASRILAEGQQDGDWVQWASDTLLQDLELYDDPDQGAGVWKHGDEVVLARELGEKLWQAVGSDPFSAAELLSGPDQSEQVRATAARLVQIMDANGRVNAIGN
jgi:hypothetical protein